MSEQRCHKCNQPLRPNAKFCPHCGTKFDEDPKKRASGILSYDDFFSDEDSKAEEPIDVKEDAKAPETPITKTAETPKQEEPTDEKPKSIFTFRDKEKEKRNKVKILDDTLELPIEEIQREIERRREKERMDARTDEEKEAGKREMAGFFDKLKDNQSDVLIPEDEIIDEADRPEKKTLFGKARSFLLGTDAPDIEGVDVQKVEASEEEKVKKAKEEQKAKPKSTWKSMLGIDEDPDIPEEPVMTSVPTEDLVSDNDEPEVVLQEPQVVPPEVYEDDVTDDVASDEPPKEVFVVDDTVVDEIPQEEKDGSELSWFQRIFGVKVDDDEEAAEGKPEKKSKVKPVVAGDVVTDSPIFADRDDEGETEVSDKPKKNPWIYAGIAAAILLVAGIGLFFTGDYMTNPLRLSENFSEAVETGDVDAMAGMLHADGASVNAQTLAPFQELLKNEEYKTELLTNLQAFNEEEGRTPDGDVWIEETGSKYLFFKAYTMKMKTFAITPEVSYPNTQISVDGGDPVNVSPDKPQTFAALLPGPHTITSTYTGGLSPLSKTADVTLTSGNDALVDGKYTADLKNAGKFATFTSPQEEAVVLINGEEKGKVKDMAKQGLKFGPFDAPVKVELRLDTPFGQVKSGEKQAQKDGEALEFTFPNMVEISDYHDEATIYINGETKGVTGKDLIPFHRMIGPVKPEDTIQMEMMQEGKLTKSNVLTVGDNEKLLFSYSKPFTFPGQYANAIVILDGVNTGQTAYEMAGDDMVADILNSYSTIQISKKFPWGTFESDTLDLDEAKTLNFSINSMNDTLIRQLQSAVVKFLEEDAFAVSNFKPDNYSNIENPLLSERRAYIESLQEENKRIVRVGDKAHFDMGSIQFDDEDGDYYARITEAYVYFYQEYQGGIFRPIRLDMTEAREVYQHAMRYDANQGEWVIYENRPKDSIGDNVESFDLAY